MFIPLAYMRWSSPHRRDRRNIILEVGKSPVTLRARFSQGKLCLNDETLYSAICNISIDQVNAPFRAPSTASLSASTLPGWLECPLIHSKRVCTFNELRSSIFARMFSTRSLFSTVLPAEVFHPFLRQLMYHEVTQSMAYLLSVMMLTSRFLGTISRALCTAVSSARWLVCRGPGKVSDTFLSSKSQLAS